VSGGIAIAAGGTGGHVFPALAVAETLRERGVAMVWIGTRHGLENRVVPAAGIALHRLAMRAVRGGGPARKLAAPLRLGAAVAAALVILARTRPALVLGMGGYVAAPAGLAARLLRIPLVIHEQNARAGLTNRLLSRIAGRVLQAFPGTFPASPAARTTGNPVRAAIAALPPPAARETFRAPPLRLLVLGGSQGARVLNETLPRVLAAWAGPAAAVWHQCGAAHVDATRAAYRAAGVEARVEAFVEDMPAAYAWAQLVVCRAGALTVSELCAAGVGALLVPLPHAADDHQRANAEHLTGNGAGHLVAESPALAARLGERLQACLEEPGALLAMAERARALARPQAGSEVADACLELISDG